MTLTEIKSHIRHITAPYVIDGLAEYSDLVANDKVIERNHTADIRHKVAVDLRTFKVGEVYHVYPIANVFGCVYIICPLCGEIDLHGNMTGGYRVPHCTGNPGLREHEYFIEME